MVAAPAGDNDNSRRARAGPSGPGPSFKVTGGPASSLEVIFPANTSLRAAVTVTVTETRTPSRRARLRLATHESSCLGERQADIFTVLSIYFRLSLSAAGGPGHGRPYRHGDAGPRRLVAGSVHTLSVLRPSAGCFITACRRRSRSVRR
jgi:hypothetical protein